MVAARCLPHGDPPNPPSQRFSGSLLPCGGQPPPPPGSVVRLSCCGLGCRWAMGTLGEDSGRWSSNGRGREQSLMERGTRAPARRVCSPRGGVRKAGDVGHSQANPGCGCGAALLGPLVGVVAVPSRTLRLPAAALGLPSKPASQCPRGAAGGSGDSSFPAVLGFLDVRFRSFPPLSFLFHTLRPSSVPCCSSSRSSPSFPLMTVLCWCPVSGV